jgi:HEPN domain-containing protein
LSHDREEAARLLRKAAEDLEVLIALADNGAIADSALGFHAQQAVEKAMKSVLAAGGHDFPWTHDLQLLLRRLEAAGVDVPDSVRTARRLSPWAVEYRYGETIDSVLDRPGTVALVGAVLDWARSAVGRDAD